MAKSIYNKWDTKNTKRYKVVNEKKVDVDTLGMLNMLKLSTHEEVVAQVMKYMDKEKYTVYSDDLWTMIVPNVENEFRMLIPNADNAFRVSLSAHTDTVRNVHPKTFSYTDKTETAICNTEDDLCGGDDRLGCWIIQQLLKEGNQDFIFTLFDQEEVGGVGSSAFVLHPDFEILKKQASCFIGLDRKGYDEMASYGYESEEFIEILEKLPDWHTDFGSFTDIATLAEKAELSCVNFSIGYYNEHGANEHIKPEETKNTLDTIRNLPSILWTKQFKCDVVYDWEEEEEEEEEDNTCERCGELLYSVEEQKKGICEYCQEKEDGYEDSSCLYCGNPTTVHTTKHGDGVCIDCMVDYYLNTNKDFCAYIVFKIMEGFNITEADKDEVYAKMREVNLISYYSLFENLKEDQIDKVDKICEKYGLPLYHL